MDDTTLEARWYIDNENGQGVLVDLRTNKIIARRINGIIVEDK